MKILITLTSVLILLNVAAPCVRAEETFREGPLTLHEYTPGDDESKKTTISTGEKVKFQIHAYIDEFFGEVVINANATMTNQTDDTLQAIYFIRFYDAEESLIGACCGQWTLSPKEEIYFGSALIKGKTEDFKNVRSYKVSTCAFKTVKK